MSSVPLPPSLLRVCFPWSVSRETPSAHNDERQSRVTSRSHWIPIREPIVVGTEVGNPICLKVAQIWFEKTCFGSSSAVYTVERIRSGSHDKGGGWNLSLLCVINAVLYLHTRHDDALPSEPVCIPTGPLLLANHRWGLQRRGCATLSIRSNVGTPAAWIGGPDYCWTLLCRRRPRTIVSPSSDCVPKYSKAAVRTFRCLFTFQILLLSHNALPFKSLPSAEVAWVTLHCSWPLSSFTLILSTAAFSWTDQGDGFCKSLSVLTNIWSHSGASLLADDIYTLVLCWSVLVSNIEWGPLGHLIKRHNMFW